MFKDYIKSGHKIKATERAYEVIYRNQGYIPYEENVNLDNLKVDELRNIAKEKGIEDYSKMKKDELISALAGE